MNTIKCAPCGHQNDPTRVFCQNCGMRLERPEGAPATISGSSPVMSRKAPGVRRGFSLGSFGTGGLGAGLGQILKTVITTAILAAIIALFVEICRTPDNIPKAEAPNEERAVKLFTAVKAFSKTVYPRTLEITQAQANNYLAARIVSDSSGEEGKFQAHFERAFVVMDEGNLRFYVEQKFLGWPVFLHLVTEPEATLDETTNMETVSLRVIGGGVAG